LKRILIIGVAVAAVIALFFGTLPTMAAKPQKSGSGKDVITLSNGFPSGEHETLLIHGKKAGYQCVECVPCSTCEPPVQCNVINVPEHGTATIKYVSGKKVKIDELTVFDSCAGWQGTDPSVDDPAEVWLPYEGQGYWVFFRALGKPGKDEEERYIIFENESLEAYPLLSDVSNPGEVVLGLGMITQQGAFKATTTGELYRFDGDSDKGKGKSQGRDFTDMFMWSGLVFHPDLDVNVDGVVNEMDVIADSCPYDADQSGDIDSVEVAVWAAAHTDPDDLNGDTKVDQLDVIMDSCPYDARTIDGVISYDGNFDPDLFPDCEFEDWLAATQGDPENPLWA
jgi:hypothetical protein